MMGDDSSDTRPLPMRLVVISHKPVWPDPTSPSGYATDGGFPAQMRALSELFEATTVCVPLVEGPKGVGTPLGGTRMEVRTLPAVRGDGVSRKLRLLPWFVRTVPQLVGAVRRADAVHAPIPGDVGTLGIVLAEAFRKPLLVRHCGNWDNRRTLAERVWRTYMERRAGGRRVMLATGGGRPSPSPSHPNVRWIFSTSLTRSELESLRPSEVKSPGCPVQLVTVGRQETYKRTDTTIRGVAELVARGHDVVFTVIGGGSALEELRRVADALGIGERVHLVGATTHPEVLQILRKCDIFVFPTNSEGFPKAVVEALAAGLPVVATPVSVLPELLRRGGGRLLHRGDARDIADRVEELLVDGSAFRDASQAALATAAELTLEHWRDTLRRHLEVAWHLAKPAGAPASPTGGHIK